MKQKESVYLVIQLDNRGSKGFENVKVLPYLFLFRLFTLSLYFLSTSGVNILYFSTETNAIYG